MADIKNKLVNGQGLQTAMGILANYSDTGDKGVIGGYSASFPISTASKGNVYYHKATNRYYICTANYSGTSLSNPNSDFEELSTYTNRQRLDNLAEYTYAKTRQSYVVPEGQYGTITKYLLSNKLYSAYYLYPKNFTDLNTITPNNKRLELTLLHADDALGVKFILCDEYATQTWFGTAWNSEYSASLIKLVR